MSLALVDRIANAVLYEGYILYPYRPSSVKNRQRWTFGGLFPPGYGADPSSLHAEMLIEGEPAGLTLQIRFLHLVQRDAWQQAMECEVAWSGPGEQRFTFPASPGQEQIDGTASVELHRIDDDLHTLTLHVANATDFKGADKTTRDEAALQAMIATHAIAEISNGAFVSLIDPPERYRDAAARCSNLGVWPVLAGEEGARNCMLVSPIILYDYPQVAPESPGDLFDSAEIDEILTLRIMTMTGEEKEEMRRTDERARRILERTESLRPEELMKLHGVLRNPHAQEWAR